MQWLLGIDAGSTVTKAVVFDLNGRVHATASQRVALQYPQPRHVERDQDELWRAVCAVTREALTDLDPADVIALGVTSHGDGIYLVDEQLRPTRPGIMSLDSRGEDIVHRWQSDGTADALFAITGQMPWASAPSVLLVWLAEHEPEILERTAWALPAKDMLKARMTGAVTTEPTEASLSFTNVMTQEYDDAIFRVIGLPGGERLLAPVIPSATIAGTLTAAAADELGLPVGTPVAAGAHDVDCSAIGSGVITPGVASVVAGSFSINQVISEDPRPGPAWFARNFVTPHRWMNMSISPTSSANMEWFVQNFCAADIAAAPPGTDPLAFIDREVAAVLDDPSEVLVTPFLFGSVNHDGAPATFTGLRAWHTRGHLLRAIMEGVALSHRTHVAALATTFPFDRVRLTGGATKSALWCQIFANALNLPVEVADHDESGAWGVALLSGIAVGAYADLAQGVAASIQVARRFQPEQPIESPDWERLAGTTIV
jgi:L-xylulokinase